MGVDGTLMAFSVIVTVISMTGALIIKNPPEGYTVSATNIFKKNIEKKAVSPVEDIPPNLFIKRKEFYILWGALAMVIGGGLTAIGLIPAYAESVLNLSPAVAATAVSAYALTNGFGRPVVGYLSDKFGTMRIMVITYIIQATVFILLPWVAVNLWLLIFCSLLLGIGYATTFALFPVLVASGFGSKYLGINYGLVFSAFGIGALTSLLGSWLLDITDSYSPAFFLAGATTIIGLLLLFVLRRGMMKKTSIS
ncbi:MAG TPA: MFS transporter [Clostridia bacterium]|nr:MFS transporter [Clostridia bacterium]HQM39465.1 MFS transporter [Clostridia bacterium]